MTDPLRWAKIKHFHLDRSAIVYVRQSTPQQVLENRESTDGLYDPTDYKDRLLLGLKGTMSEAESHVLKERHVPGHTQQGAPRRAVPLPAYPLRQAARRHSLHPTCRAGSQRSG